MSYRVCNKDEWTGRVDSIDNYDAFRWHQIVEVLDLEDDSLLVDKSKLNIGFIGFSCDEGIKLNKGREGAARGPEIIRRELCNLPCLFTEDVKLYDCGTIVIENEELSQLQGQLGLKVKKMLDLNIFPIVLGGGHELAFGHYLGLREEYEDLSIINLDAHLDMRPYDKTPSSGTMFRQIGDICREEKKEFKYLCVGIQRRGNTIDLLKTAKAYGGKYIYARDILHGDHVRATNTLMDYIDLSRDIYLTLCTDVIASAHAPGVSAPQPLGIDPETVVDIIKVTVRSGKLRAFDVAEISPRYDHDNTTASLGATFIFSIVNELSKIKGYAADEYI